uniref:Uncharacterized protein n=1 Tax=Globodera rostochiensis TaxID=31243 RepID=A0A914IBF1_GLORO
MKKDKKEVPSDAKLPARKVREGGIWADDGPKYAHFWEPILKTSVVGVQERRIVQAELALGSRENTASAKVRIECRVAQKYSDKPNDERTKIRDNACGNAQATKQFGRKWAYCRIIRCRRRRKCRTCA